VRGFFRIKSLLLYGTMMLFQHIACAQKHDSTTLYKKIKKFANKNSFTEAIYNAVFTEPKPEEYPVQPTKEQGKVLNPYQKYKGKTIREININVYDPFGYTVNDTVTGPVKKLDKFGNKMHITTRNWVVNNKLLFKKGDEVNPLFISESERLLRQAPFANDAKIYIKQVRNSDEVDVYVVVLDKVTMSVPAELTDLTANLRFRDENLFGFGHTFEQYVGYNRPNAFNYSGFYSVANIDNTYISSRAAYQTDSTGTNVGLSFDRPFYSPLTKWAGGVSLSHTQHFYQYKDTVSGLNRDLNVAGVGYDIWGGRALKVFKGETIFKQSHNLIVAARYYTTTFIKRPDEAISVMRSNNNTSAVLGNVGFAIQQYNKDKYIYRFGASEDVPQGLIIQFLYGAQKKEFVPLRYYAGFEIARAKHFDIGYVSATYSYGMFFNDNSPNDISMNYKLYYFTDLFKKGGWYFRQFLNYTIVHGEHKYYNENLTLTSDEMYGLNTQGVVGKTKMVLNLETVAYAPYNLIGFHLAPVLMVGYGMLGSPDSPILTNDIYQAYSLGLMFRNENLLNSTFQVSFGYYPDFPSWGRNVLVYNPVTSFTIRVRAFAVGKPDFVGY
jgi:hypothetical protein